MDTIAVWVGKVEEFEEYKLWQRAVQPKAQWRVYKHELLSEDGSIRFLRVMEVEDIAGHIFRSSIRIGTWYQSRQVLRMAELIGVHTRKESAS
jgi:uncharacterized protein (DUF2384 family)